MSFDNPPGSAETLHTFKKRLYGVLHEMTTAERGTPDILVILKHPSTKGSVYGATYTIPRYLHL
jgi:hypothetical protein